MAGYTDLCSSAWYANAVGCSVGHWIDDFILYAQQSEAALDQAVADLSTAYDANTTTPTYNPAISTVPQTFVPPVTAPERGSYAGLAPTEVVLPSRAGLLTSAESDAIFARGRSRITRAHTANVREALEGPASLGIGMAAPALLRRVAAAEQKRAEATTQVALEQAAQEGAWAREDIKTIIQMELDNFGKKWTVTKERLTAEEDTLKAGIAQFTSELQREAERRGWSQMEIEALLKEAADGANVAIQWGQITLNKLMQVEEIVVKMKAAVFQAWLSQAHLSMGFTASQGISSNGEP